MLALTRPQRGDLTRLGRGCPVRLYYSAAARPKSTRQRGVGEVVRVFGRKDESRGVVPADSYEYRHLRPSAQPQPSWSGA
jgi:hypothetical protein